MGGDTVRAEEESLSDTEFSRSSSRYSSLFLRDDVVVKGGYSEEFGTKSSVKYSNCEVDRIKREKVYKDVLQSYDKLQERIGSLNAAKRKMQSYSPGSWIERSNGVKLDSYDVRKTASIILIGPKGSGKSSLINRIIRVVENDWFAPDRAQVSYGSSSEEGTLFLQEYMIPRASPTFCIYDTRGLCQNLTDNVSMIKWWITKGVRSGEPVIWKSDSSSLKEMINTRSHKNISEKKKIDAVIFVVNMIDVLKSMESDCLNQTSYAQMISASFKCPFLSFKDDKPAVVMTHGDLLSREERARARVFLGYLLGVPPDTQIFDVPDIQEEATELTVCYLLRHCLEHCEKNLQILSSMKSTVFKAGSVKQRTIITISWLILLAVVVFTVCYHKPKGYVREPDVPSLDWAKMRHLWFDGD